MASIKDYLHLNFIVVIWGFTAILGLLINIPAVEVVFYRTLISALAIVALIKFSGNKLTIDKTSILKMLLTGAVIAIHWILFFESARVSNASISLIGLATVALWTSILEPLANRIKIKSLEVILGLVIIVGMYIIYSNDLSPSFKEGLIMAVVSAMLSAVFSVINGKLAPAYHHLTITFYEMVGACLTIVVFIPMYNEFFSKTGTFQWRISWSDFGYLVLLALVCTVYAFSASVELLRRVSVFASNLFVQMEPVYGILLAVLIFRETEKMNSGFYLGGSVIVLAVLSYPMVKYYQKNRIRTGSQQTFPDD